jgi:hypothetical protein
MDEFLFGGGDYRYLTYRLPHVIVARSVHVHIAPFMQLVLVDRASPIRILNRELVPKFQHVCK